MELDPTFSGHSTVPSPLAKHGAFSLVESVADVSVVVDEAAADGIYVRLLPPFLPLTTYDRDAAKDNLIGL